MARMRIGVHPVLEAEADRLIRESLRGVTKWGEKADVITDFKRKKVRSREVYVESGVPDRASRQGMYHRVANPVQTHLNSRDGIAGSVDARGAMSESTEALADFVRKNRREPRDPRDY